MKKIRSINNYTVAKYLPVLLLALISLAACSKDENDDPQSEADYEVAGKWRLAAMTVSPPIDGTTDYLAYQNKLLGNDCLETMIHFFKNDGKLTAEFSQACQNSDLSYDNTASWKVQGDKIIITNAGMTGQYTLKVDKSTMTWVSSEVDSDSGLTFTLTYTYKRV